MDDPGQQSGSGFRRDCGTSPGWARTVCGGGGGMGKAEESRRRPLLASPNPATGPRGMMDAQGASRAGRRRRYAEEVGVGEGALTFFTAGWKWKSPASFRSNQIMGMRGTASMVAGARGRSAAPLAAPAAASAARPTPPLRAGWPSSRGDEGACLLGDAVPARAAFCTCAVSFPPRGAPEGEAPAPGERASGNSSLPPLSCVARCLLVPAPIQTHLPGLASGLAAALFSQGTGIGERTHELVVPSSVEGHGGRGVGWGGGAMVEITRWTGPPEEGTWKLSPKSLYSSS